jgi:hypothetical protein
MVTRKVLGGVLAFPKRHVSRLHKNSGPRGSGPFAVRLGVLHPDQDRVTFLPRAWRCAISPHVGDYDRTIAGGAPACRSRHRERRMKDGRTKKEAVRCLTRYVAREVLAALPRSQFGLDNP